MSLQMNESGAIRISNGRWSGPESPWVCEAIVDSPDRFVLESCFSSKTLSLTRAEARRLRDALAAWLDAAALFKKSKQKEERT